MDDRLTARRLVEQLGVTPLIAAGGPNTKHSGTRPRPETLRAMEEMSEVFVHMDEWLIATGSEIAKLVGAPAATVTSGASGGLELQAAAAIARDNPDAIASLPDTGDLPNELIIQRTHRFAYDHLYLVPGSTLVEVGTDEGCDSDDIERAISDRTAGIIHLVSPGVDERSVPLEEVVHIAHDHGLPVLCDAASMLPPRANLRRFVDAGADLVSFSGGKGVRGPQSTGFLIGDPRWVEYARLNNAPNATVARAQKVSKEEIAGLVAALRVFVNEDEDAETERYKRQMQSIVDRVSEVPGVVATVKHDNQHYIPHAVVELTKEWRGPSGQEIGRLMMEAPQRIYIRSTYADGRRVAVDPLNIQDGELEEVAEKLRRVLVESIS